MAIESSDNPVHPGEERAGKGPSFRSLAIIALVLLVIGIIAGGWAMNRWLASGEAEPIAKVIDTAAPGGTASAANAQLAPGASVQPPAALPPGGAEALPARVAELEMRLSRINADASAAAGNAARAEGLLVAFATRRALDRGLELRYLEAQLQLRFGDDLPNAVKTIIETSRDPTTLEQLRAEFEAHAADLVGRSAGDGGNLWTGIRREMSELFVVRAANAPSPRASERLDRARRYLASGQVEKAIEEVQEMPGAASAEQWLIDARRYHEARRALDLIEQAAILEPRDGSAAALVGEKPAAPAR